MERACTMPTSPLRRQRQTLALAALLLLLQRKTASGLLLGFSNTPEEQMPSAVRHLPPGHPPLTINVIDQGGPSRLRGLPREQGECSPGGGTNLGSHSPSIQPFLNVPAFRCLQVLLLLKCKAEASWNPPRHQRPQATIPTLSATTFTSSPAIASNSSSNPMATSSCCPSFRPQPIRGMVPKRKGRPVSLHDDGRSNRRGSHGQVCPRNTPLIGIDTNILVRHLTQDDPVQSPRRHTHLERFMSASRTPDSSAWSPLLKPSGFCADHSVCPMKPSLRSSNKFSRPKRCSFKTSGSLHRHRSPSNPARRRSTTPSSEPSAAGPAVPTPSPSTGKPPASKIFNSPDSENQACFSAQPALSCAHSANPYATEVNSFPPRILSLPNRRAKIRRTAGTDEVPPVKNTRSTSFGSTARILSSASTPLQWLADHRRSTSQTHAASNQSADRARHPENETRSLAAATAQNSAAAPPDAAGIPDLLDHRDQRLNLLRLQRPNARAPQNLTHIIRPQKRKIVPALQVRVDPCRHRGKNLVQRPRFRMRSQCRRNQLPHNPRVESIPRQSDSAVAENRGCAPARSRTPDLHAAAKNRWCPPQNRQSRSVHRGPAWTRRRTPQPPAPVQSPPLQSRQAEMPPAAVRQQSRHRPFVSAPQIAPAAPPPPAELAARIAFPHACASRSASAKSVLPAVPPPKHLRPRQRAARQMRLQRLHQPPLLVGVQIALNRRRSRPAVRPLHPAGRRDLLEIKYRPRSQRLRTGKIERSQFHPRIARHQRNRAVRSPEIDSRNTQRLQSPPRRGSEPPQKKHIADLTFSFDPNPVSSWRRA